MAAETPTNRPRNAATTRLGILEAARECFLRDGYDQVGLRAIGAGAEVDPALICRYFGSKENLFAEVLAGSVQDPMDVLAGDRDTFGERVARALFDPAERSRDRTAFIQLSTRSSSSPVAAKLIREHIERQFMAPFTEWLGGDRAAEKAWLIGAALMGMATLVGLDSPPPEGADAVERVASLLQHIIDSP